MALDAQALINNLIITKSEPATSSLSAEESPDKAEADAALSAMMGAEHRPE